MKVRIDDHELRSVGLYRPLPLLLRLDVLPFLFFYATAVYLYCIRPSEDVIVSIFTAIIVLFHALAFLLAEWSVDAKCWMQFVTLYRIPRPEESAGFEPFAKVLPLRHTLPKQMCQCHVAIAAFQKGRKKLESGEAIPVVWFLYQNLSFCLYDDLDALNQANDLVAVFRRLDFPTQHAIGQYQATSGYTNAKELEMAQLKWGSNDFEIPIPGFLTLLKEQLVAPFFVFQFFCMLLWCLDEYVYYSVLTLLMLVIFECTVVKQRQRNMEALNQMRRAPQSCYVYRSKKWTQVWSDDLVPGDVISIGLKLSSTTSSRSVSAGESNEVLVPCDLLLLRGHCVVNESMLSGESIPLRKEALNGATNSTEAKQTADLSECLQIDDGTSRKHKKFVLYGGTKILQQSLPPTTSNGTKPSIPDAPDRGCIAYVLRTGFGTTQGSLMRTILYSSQRVTANNREAMWFILLLLGFAISASSYVLHQGLQDPSRNRFKLVLHCIMIITSVVPPELPMELSLAVTNSLIALSKYHIFCTEPFRIPFAGRIDICCFDKTGTLTSDELKLHGVAGLETEILSLSDDDMASKKRKKRMGLLDLIAPENLPLETELVLAGCQSLVLLNGQVAGDPIELTALHHIKWNVGYTTTGDVLSVRPSVASSCHEVVEKVDILRRFSFMSELKRMTTIVRVCKQSADQVDQLVLTKGAPEVLEPLMSKKPATYGRIYRHFAAKGCRVLALAYRPLANTLAFDVINQLTRSEVETDLVFAGFLVLDCPLKEDSKRVVRDLMVSKHKVVMVTGDNALTACEVARQVGINAGYSKTPLILSLNNSKTLEWAPIDDGSMDKLEPQAFESTTISSLAAQYDLCITGDALTYLYEAQATSKMNENALLQQFLAMIGPLCAHATVFARTSPQQKEWIVMALNRLGRTTAMCGDGTNDVGALKQAHIGVSVVNCPELEQRMASAQARAKKHGNQELSDRLRQLQEEEEAQIVKLGDASIASPFTSKSASIRVMKHLVRHGRCTLVTTIQMYKILGINCLITAYYLSSLFLHGVKNGDQQLTIIGLVIAMFFLFISRAKPAKRLSHVRPPHGVFCLSVLASIGGQFVIHLGFLATALHVAAPFSDPNDPAMHPDGKFRPNVINSIMFLLSSVMQVNTFVVNYKGQPFMQGFWDHTMLSRSALVAYVILGMAAFEVFPPINEMLELVSMPSYEMQLKVFGLMAGDTLVTWSYEAILQQIASSV